jgi:D-alanyl-D-alanine carboxypeptidase/D-alanyl-D-alanine-endopeptidase (penicillin-binding protein 4)
MLKKHSNLRTLPRLLFLIASILTLGVSASGLLHTTGKADALSQPGTASLQSEIDAILADPRLKGAQADVLVRDAEDGSVLYARDESNLLIPASNNKLYSSGAALEVLGTDYQFVTTAAADGKRKGSTIFGNLYLKGTGDPTAQAADYDKLAAEIAGKGIKKITGRLIADDTFFDSRQLGYNWGWDSNPYYYQPEISALTVAADSDFNISALIVETTPGSTPGQPANIRTIPETKYVTIQNETTTGPAGSADNIAVERELGVNTIVVSGSIAADSPAEKDISTVTDPTGYAASVFKDALKRHGVRVAGKAKRGTTPADASILAERKSAPLSELMTPLLKLSNNGIAEILVKSMGKKTGGAGSWGAGMDAELTALQAHLGINPDELQLVDGSGLSNVSFTSAKQITDLLLAAQRKPWFSMWYNALPIAGQPDPLVGGTLRSRMVGTKAAGNVHAKTGSLDNVSALSGYVKNADGKLLVFSVMENNFIHGSAKPLEDAIAVTLANFSPESGVQTDETDTLRAESLFSPTRSKVHGHGLECSWTKEGC